MNRARPRGTKPTPKSTGLRMLKLLRTQKNRKLGMQQSGMGDAKRKLGICGMYQAVLACPEDLGVALFSSLPTAQREEAVEGLLVAHSAARPAPVRLRVHMFSVACKDCGPAPTHDAQVRANGRKPLLLAGCITGLSFPARVARAYLSCLSANVVVKCFSVHSTVAKLL